MKKYTCLNCLKDFKQKSHYDKHNIKKNLCNNTIEKMQIVIDKLVKKILSEKIELNNINSYNNNINMTSLILSEKKNDYSNLSKTDLLIKCNELGITKCISKKKSELINLIKCKIGIDIKQEVNQEVNQEAGTEDESEAELEAGTEDESEGELEAESNENKYTFIEVCAGGGGLSCGLIKAGFTPLLLNDNNKDCCETLKKNHDNINIICNPMEKIDLTPYINKVDLLAGGIPCQSFSQSGLRKGLDDPRGQLIYTFIKMIKTVKPKIFMIENVKGLITHNNGNTITEIINLLDNEKLYNIEYKLLNSAEYNVPQKRERVFIVGTLKSLNLQFIFPEKKPNIIVLKDVLIDVPVSIGEKYNEEKKKLFKLIPQGGCWINLPIEKQKAYLGNSYFSGGGKRGILYRLSMTKPSLTLLCTPSQKQTERCHPLEERPLNIREYARIQTFPDDYIFCGSMASQYKQIGNAVPVELAMHMGINLINALKN
jgi:DNA (cytosine-5)-methyltransferase 1